MKKLKLITKELAECINIQEEDIDMTFFENINEMELANATGNTMFMRISDEFTGKAICLSSRFDYEFGTDSRGCVILIPLKKK